MKTLSQTRQLRCVSYLLCSLFAVNAATALAQTAVLDDDDASVLYFGEWSRELDGLSGEGSYHSSSAAGARVSVEFSGDFVRVLAPTGPEMGQAEVQLCALNGMRCESASIDERSKIVQHGQVVFARYGLPSGRYRLELQLPDAVSGRIGIDSIATGSALTGTRYIDNRDSRCSNEHAGDSAAAPWCDFSRVNGETLAAGAQLLLARGAVWNEQLGKLYGEGSADSWIVVDAYGEGPRPAIRRSGAATDRALWLDNPSYWRVSQLEISHAGAGLVCYFTTNGHSGLRFDHLYTHDNSAVHWRSADDWAPAADLPGMYHGAAIFITGNVPVTDNAAAISDVEISDIESEHDADPLDIAGFNPSPGRLNFLSTTLGHHAARDVRVHNVYFHDAKGAPNFDNVERLSLFSSRLSRMCTEHQEIGTTSLFFWSVDDVAVTNNVISDVPYTDSPDGTGTDLESVSSRVRFRSNWYLNNVGAGIEILAARGAADYQRDHEISGNVFYQNGLTGPRYFTGVPQEASLFILNQTGQPELVTGRAQHNLYFEPGGFISSEPIGQFAWELLGNQSVSARSVFDGRARASGATTSPAMRYELFDGSRFRELSAQQDRWEAEDALLTAFDMQPPACAGCYLARAWRAPYKGTIAVRGWAMKNEFGGDGVALRITKNGAQAWPPKSGWHSLGADDGEGFATYLDDVAVEPGDTLRFEVAPGSGKDNHADLISWSPTIAYTRKAENTLVIVQNDAPGERVSYSAGHWIERDGVHEADSQDASLSLAFEGTQVTVRGRRGPEQGAVMFTVCTGEPARCLDEAAVELFESEERTDQVLWTSPIVPVGSYTLRMRAAPAPSGAGSRMNFDYATISTDTRFINNDDEGSGLDQVEYRGAGWSKVGNIHYHEGSAPEVYYLVRFTGSQVTISGGKNVDRGITAFSVCDRDGDGCGPESLVDQYAPTLQIKQMLWTSPVLSQGEHAIRARPTGMRNGASTGSIVDFDRAIVD